MFYHFLGSQLYRTGIGVSQTNGQAVGFGTMIVILVLAHSLTRWVAWGEIWPLRASVCHL